MSTTRYSGTSRRTYIGLLSSGCLVAVAGCVSNDETNPSTSDETDEGSTDSSGTDIQLSDIVKSVRFDPVTNDAFVELASEITADEVVIESANADEVTRVQADAFGEIHSIPVSHTGDIVSFRVVTGESDIVVGEEEWTPPTPKEFDSERFDETGRVVDRLTVVDTDYGYTARVFFVDDIDATEVRIQSTVAEGVFESDTPESIDYGDVQINAAHDEVTVFAVNGEKEEIVHREHIEPS